MDNLTTTQKKERAQQEFSLARDYAKQSNAAWEIAGELHKIHTRALDRFKNWKNILSTAPMFAMNAAFIPICVAEYYFSREIYRDIAPKAPWAIAFGLIAIGVVISELLVYKFFAQKRAWKQYEMRHQDESKVTQTDENITSQVKSYANQMFVIGLLLAIAILTLITFFSKERANREILAGVRSNPFGIQDYMPIGLYLFEILTGFFIWFSCRMALLSLKVKMTKNRINKEKKKCVDFGGLAVKKFEDAEEFDLNVFEMDTTPDKYFSTAVFRNKEGNFTDDEKFFEEPQRVKNKVTFLISDNNQPLFCKVYILTEYKVLISDSTKSDGIVTFEFESFPNDMVRDIILTRSDVDGKPSISKPEHGSYPLNKPEPITIDWG